MTKIECLAWRLAVMLALAFNALAASGLVDTAASPYARVRTVGLGDVRWTEGFWADRVETCRTRTIPGMWALMAGTNYSHFLQNFRIAAGLEEGRYRGAPFNDGDFYKWFEAACVMFGAARDREWDHRIEEAVRIIGKAQRADGYLHTPVLVRRRNGDLEAKPFQDRHNFEMYNMGHLLTTACVHHRVTGRTNLLAIAVRTADFLYETFRDASPESARSSVCPSHYMGMIELYRATREPRYLELAKTFFKLRSQIADGGDDNQDRIPFQQQTNAMGHAVRANYLYAGAADLFMETGESEWWAPLEPIWTNVVQQKMYITGGCGALYDGASPDGSRDQKSITRVHQAYGRNYQLPNVTAHSETCANIGNVLWNWRMFLATGEARFVDVLELALYNSVLSGIGLDGTNYFYVNPLRTVDPLPTELRWSRTRVPFVGSFCCPPNLVRTVAEVGNYAYSLSEEAIWVNLYGGSLLTTKLPDGRKAALAQETEYPWNGRVRITIKECEGKGFALKLRIPGWLRTTEEMPVRINGALTNVAVAPSSYLELRREWKAGDIVELEMPMPTRLLESHPFVEETRNQAAVQRGPLVYCLESTDLPSHTRLLQLSLPADIDLVARYERRLLGGVTLLEGVGLARAEEDWSGQLYREIESGPPRPVKLQLVPYFAWGNRGSSEMTVWMPLVRNKK